MRTLRICVGLAFACTLATPSLAQVEPSHITADTNNAVIGGRVAFPSGFAAERNIRITLSNSQSMLTTLYTNKHGEFNITNLSEGVYFVQADDPGFDPVVAKVMLGRGITMEITLQLREKLVVHTTIYAGRVVSAAELQQSVPREAKKEYDRGVKFVTKGNVAQAATHFKGALSLYPEYLAARNDLGVQYLKLKRLDEAEADFRNVLERDPKNFNAKFNLGLVRIERRDYIDALSHLNQAIAIDSTRPVARLWLGFALLEIGNSSAAEQELTKALIMGGAECIAAHFHLARIYLSRRDKPQAALALRTYLEEAPKGEHAKEARELQKQLKAEVK